MVKKIVHISDIHIRLVSRLKEYEYVFNSLYNKLQEIKDEFIIVLTGDIFHSKTELSPESVTLAKNLFISLSNIAPTFIIPGNHDANLFNDNRMDSITPIIDTIKFSNNILPLTYYKNSGVYNYKNLDFVHLSVFDDVDKYSEIISNYEKNENVSIILYHGVVQNCKLPNNMLLADGLSNNILEQADLALLGDIHLFQYMNDNKTIAYPGSLICQNYGEKLEHGFLIWDVENKDSEFIEIYNKYSYCNVFENNYDKINIPEEGKIKLNVNNDIDDSKLNSIVFNIKQKYPNLTDFTINKINSKENTQVLTKNEILDLIDIKDTFQIILKYIQKNNKLTQDDIDILRKMHSIYENSIVIDEKYNHKWHPIKFEWSNTFSYGENNCLDFSNIDNNIIGIFAPNRTGKTSFIESLTYTLFDKINKDSNLSGILNVDSDMFKCRLTLNLNDEIYLIEKIVKRTKTGASLSNFKFEKQIDGVFESLNDVDKNATIKLMRELIGTYENFILTAYNSQFKNKSIIDIGDSDRKTLISQFIGLDVFDKYHELCKNVIKELNAVIKFKNIDKLNSELQTNELDIEHTNKCIEDIHKKLTDFEESIEEQQKLINELELQKNLIQIENIDIDKINSEYYSINNKIKELNDNNIKSNEKLNFLEKSIEDIKINEEEIGIIEKNYFEILKLSDEEKKLSNDFNLYEIKIKQKIDKSDKLLVLEYDENCTYCMNNVFVKDAINAKSEIQRDLDEATNLKNKLDEIKKLTINKNDIETKYFSLNNKLKELNNLKQLKINVNNEISNNNIKLNELNNKLLEITKKQEQYEKNKILIQDKFLLEQEIYQKNNKLNIDKSSYKTLNSDLQREIANKSYKENQMDNLLKEIEEYNNTKKLVDLYNIYLQATHRDGVQLDIISNILPYLQATINNMLKNVDESQVILELDKNKDISIFINYGDKVWSTGLISGMEKFMLSLVTRTALMKICNIPHPDFLIIDEGFGVLDADNFGNIKTLMEYLKTEFKFIMLVSHIAQVKEMADVVINIDKIDNRSKLYYA